MKFLFLLSVFLYQTVAAQSIIIRENSSADQTAFLQNAFNTNNTVVISAPIIINGTVSIPKGKVLKFEGGKISGKGTINGGIIEANYHTAIFDTSLTINPKAVNQYFSVKWFGAAGNNNADDYVAIQKAINISLKNNLRAVFFPAGRYKISKPLIITSTAGFCTLELFGESSFWDAAMGSEIYTTFNNTFAIGIQNGKGCKIRKLSISGLFAPPNTNDRKKFYNTPFEKFIDGNSRDSRFSPYAGVVIDPFTNDAGLPEDGGYPGLAAFYGKHSGLGGSTGIELEDLSIRNFVVGIISSPNGKTRNAEISIFHKIQFENCKLCIGNCQDQEKGNVIDGIYCWGGTHTIFANTYYGAATARMAGNYNIDHCNIAGNVIRFIYNEQHGYFPTYIAHVFAESLGMWGTINSEIASSISDCHIDFEYPEVAGEQTLITSWGENIVYRSCNFRYYGAKTPMKIEGNATFDHCFFSGSLVKKGSFTGTFFSFKQPYNSPLVIYLGIALALTGIAFFILKRTGIHFS